MFTVDYVKKKSIEDLKNIDKKYRFILIACLLLSNAFGALIKNFIFPESKLIGLVLTLFVSSLFSIFIIKESLNLSYGVDKVKIESNKIMSLWIKIFLVRLIFDGFILTDEISKLIMQIGSMALIIMFIGCIISIIFYFWFSQSQYILVEDDSKSLYEVLKESKDLMKNHKMDYLYMSWLIFWYSLKIIIAISILSAILTVIGLPNTIISIVKIILEGYYYYPIINIFGANFYTELVKYKDDKEIEYI